MRIAIRNGEGFKIYKIPEGYPNRELPLRELIIHVLAKRRNKQEFWLIFDDVERNLLNAILFYHFMKNPFSRYGETGVIIDFIENFLLADFKASYGGHAFSVLPFVTDLNNAENAPLGIRCVAWDHMISHAKYLKEQIKKAKKK